VSVHQAAKLQIERIVHEFARWRRMPDDERSPAPAWWWGPAIDVLDEAETMSQDLCAGFELPPGSSYGDGAEVLMKALAEQTSLSWPDEFPKKIRQTGLA
jgi:hypothetical protein